MPAALVRGGRAVTLPVAQVIPIALKEACRPAGGQVLSNPYAFTKILVFTESLAFAKSFARARDNAIAQDIPDPEIFSHPKILADTQTYSGAEARCGAG